MTTSNGPAGSAASARGRERARPCPRGRIGVLHGEGIGPEVVGAALDVLSALEVPGGPRFELEVGPGLAGPGVEHLSEAEAAFCQRLFDAGAPLLCGPRGGRFVYELRERFGLFCKLSPVRPLAALADTGPLRPSATPVDLLFVRENAGGLYFGRHELRHVDGVPVEGRHTYGYERREVERILGLAASLALSRRGRLALVVKTAGVPSISTLWKDRLVAVCAGRRIALEVLEIDNACYQVVADAGRFDVVVSPNMFGDVLADVAALRLGSRGLSHSVNLGAGPAAVYQTGHGAALDLAGRDRANPIGQILSLADLLERSLAQPALAAALRAAVERVLAEGWRTDDVMAPGCTRVGTRELGKRIADRAHALAAQRAAS